MLEMNWDLVVTNLYKLYACMIVYFWIYGSNMVLGALRNVINLRQQFDAKKFFQSILKVLVLAIGVGGLCIGITTLPIIAAYVGWDIPIEYQEAIANVVIFGIFLLGAYIKAKEALEKLNALMLGADKEKEEVMLENSLADLINETQADELIATEQVAVEG